MPRRYALPALSVGLMLSVLSLAPVTAVAKDDDDRDRTSFHGWVEVMPEGLHGTWIIGGQQVVTNPRTEFDQTEGPLMVGGCAKVDIRGRLVHEIDSEPSRNCR
jgi:hypothetical protein